MFGDSTLSGEPKKLNINKIDMTQDDMNLQDDHWLRQCFI